MATTTYYFWSYAAGGARSALVFAVDSPCDMKWAVARAKTVNATPGFTRRGLITHISDRHIASPDRSPETIRTSGATLVAIATG